MSELSIIQKVYDLIIWYNPIITRLPTKHKFTLGERMIDHLYDILETLIYIKYSREKLDRLIGLNAKLDILRYQTRILRDLSELSIERYEYVSKQIDGIGVELGSWIKQQKDNRKPSRENP